MKVSSFFLFCSGLENVSDTPVAYQSRSAACVEITLSSFYHKSKNIELPLGWLDIFFLSIFCVSVLFRGDAFSFSAAGISRRTGIGGVRRGQTEENDCRGMLASTKNLSAISRYHKNLAMSRINLQDSCYNRLTDTSFCDRIQSNLVAACVFWGNLDEFWQTNASAA